jgi:hypothetical protein
LDRVVLFIIAGSASFFPAGEDIPADALKSRSHAVLFPGSFFHRSCAFEHSFMAWITTGHPYPVMLKKSKKFVRSYSTARKDVYNYSKDASRQAPGGIRKRA